MDSLKVLLVDDEPDLLEQAKIFLEKEEKGIEIETALSAEEGLKKLDKEDYDAIVADYQMPKLDGLEFLEILRKDWESDIPFIVFTGRGREKVAIEALNLGADRYLQKGGEPRSQYGILAKAIKQEVTHWKGKEKLENRKKRLDAVFNASNEIIFTKNEEGNYTQANEAFAKKFGLSMDDIIGKGDEEIFSEEEAKRIRKMDEKVLEKGESITSLGKLTVDGEKRFFETNKVPLRNKDGEVMGVCGFARDITDLRKAEERFRRFFENLGDAVFVTKVGGENKGEILEVNPAAEKQTGYSREELLKMNIINDLAVKGSKVTDQKSVDERLSEGETVNFQQKKRKKDGTEYWTEVVVTPIEYKGEKASLSINRDITERKRMEDRLMHLFETAPDAVLLMNKERKIEGINEEFKEMMGYSREELVGNKLSKAPFIPEEERKTLEENLKNRIGKGFSPFTAKFKTKDGENIFMEVNASFLKTDEKIIGSLAIARNITERKRMEKKLQEERAELRSLLRGSDDSIYMVDKNCRYVLVNDELLKRLNKERNAVIGSRFQDFHKEEKSRKFSEKVREVFETGQSLKQEYEMGNEDKWFLRTFSPVEDLETGEVKNVVIISKDITERKRAQEREDFLHSLLRHDLSNKANLINGYHELLLDTDLSEKQLEYLESAIECNRESAELIEKIRTLHRVGKAELEDTNIDFILDEVIEEKKSLANENDIKIVCEKAKNEVRGGPLLKELCSNVIENSIKHSGCNKIKIKTQNLGEEVKISFEDNGRGIPKEERKKVLEKGFRKGKDSGSGLGLHLVKKIAESYGGNVEITDSELGGVKVNVGLKKPENS